MATFVVVKTVELDAVIDAFMDVPLPVEVEINVAVLVAFVTEMVGLEIAEVDVEFKGTILVPLIVTLPTIIVVNVPFDLVDDDIFPGVVANAVLLVGTVVFLVIVLDAVELTNLVLQSVPKVQ